jgi:hypothetical protein
MTKLECNVNNCSSNTDNCCCRPNIHVAGKRASDTAGTFCDSFTTLSQSATNIVNYNRKNPSMPVSCDVKNCVYNRQDLCDADKIKIENRNANTGDQTNCATFICK